MKIKAYNRKKIFGAAFLVIGLALLTVFVLFSLFPSKLAPYSPSFSFEAFQKASPEHLFGTNNMGYDILSELIYATSSTLTIGLLSALISLVIGTVIGLAAGYIGGYVGGALNGFISFFLLIPMLPLAIVFAAYLGAGQLNIILIIALLGWCGTARAVRAKTIQLKQMPYIEIMRGLNYSRTRIIFRHILPNLTDVIFAKYVMTVSSCVLLEATLSFLGLGDVSKVTWGSMINLAYKHGGLARGAYNWFLAPGVCIMLLTLSFYLINYFIEIKSRAVKGGSILE